jgi:hypothetical protein
MANESQKLDWWNLANLGAFSTSGADDRQTVLPKCNIWMDEIGDIPLIFVKAWSAIAMKESNQRHWIRCAGRGRSDASM